MNKTTLWVLVLLMAGSLGCRKENTATSPEANTIVIANTLNAFSFQLSANSYTATLDYTTSFSTDSLACSVTVTGYASGSGSISIADSNYSSVYADSILTNQVVAFTQAGKGVPRRIHLVFSQYTGTIVFALARNGSGR